MFVIPVLDHTSYHKLISQTHRLSAHKAVWQIVHTRLMGQDLPPPASGTIYKIQLPEFEINVGIVQTVNGG